MYLCIEVQAKITVKPVSNETCSSGRLPYESGQVTNVPNNSKTFNTGVFWTFYVAVMQING